MIPRAESGYRWLRQMISPTESGYRWRRERQRQRTDQPTRTSQTTLESELRATYENQDSIKALLLSRGILCIVLVCLPPVHHVEVETGIAGLGRLGERSENGLGPMFSQCPATRALYYLERTKSDRCVVTGTPFRSRLPLVVTRDSVVERAVWAEWVE